MPVDAEGIALDNREPRRTKCLRKPAIPLDRHNFQPTLEQRCGQRPLPWPDLKHGLAWNRTQGVHDPSQNLAIMEKMLTEPSQTWIRTRVRSSLARVPPVNAAMSVNTASRIWRAGRWRRLITWLNTRCSPNRSPLGPRASANPSVNRQRMALPR